MPRTNLPPSSGPLVGRRAERDTLLSLLRGEARVVTITGAAGVGKTRLAVDVAEALLAEGRFAEAWRCDLGDAKDAAGVCDAVGQAIGAGGARREGAASGLGLALDARGDALVLLDEMEGAAGAAAETVGAWLAAAPSAVFLITSREPLHLAGEALFELGPLPLPPRGEASGDAVELFVKCTQRARPGYTLTDAEAPFVGALVSELDGLPLAIELCAPRMAVMGARALLHRMSSRFDLLKKQGARAGDRHATLAAAIDASYQTLSPEEQSALGQCAVFRGGFTVEAAEAVIDLSAFGAPAVIDVLQGLRQRSLLRAADASGVPGEVRLAMFAGVRAYAIDKLSAEDRAAACERHAHHVVRAAEEHERHLAGKDGPERRARILAERDNLLEVIDRVLGRGPVSSRTAEPALRALLVLSNVAPETGPLETFVRALDPVLTATKDSGADPRLSARALHARGVLLLSRGDVRGGSRDLVQALAVARTLGDAALEARATSALGGALATRGDRASAREHLQRAADAFQRLGDAGSAATATASLADLAHREGRAAEAEALAERALSIHSAQKDLLGEANDRVLLGRFAADRGDLRAARAHLGRSVVLARESESRKVEALANGWLGLVAQLDHHRDSSTDQASRSPTEGPLDRAARAPTEGPLDRAARATAEGASNSEARGLFEGAASALGAMGLVPAEALFTGLLGVALREQGASAEAFARLGAATERIANGGDDAHLALFLVHLASLDADIGRAAEAAATLARAEKLLERAAEPAILAIAALVRARIEPSREAEALAAARAIAPFSAYVRVAIACLDIASTSVAPPPPPPDDALLVGPAGLWFRVPHGEKVLLDRRRQLAKMLDRLAEERASRPGSALGWEALLGAGWPGERVLPEAAAHRVRVAVSTLRKLGLRDMLRTTEDGYLLVPDIPAIRAA